MSLIHYNDIKPPEEQPCCNYNPTKEETELIQLLSVWRKISKNLPKNIEVVYEECKNKLSESIEQRYILLDRLRMNKIEDVIVKNVQLAIEKNDEDIAAIAFGEINEHFVCGGFTADEATKLIDSMGSLIPKPLAVRFENGFYELERKREIEDIEYRQMGAKK